MTNRTDVSFIAFLCFGFFVSAANADAGAAKRLHDASGELLSLVKEVNATKKAGILGGAPAVEITT